jgi:transcriptional regulator with XRE-family HTH domain
MRVYMDQLFKTRVSDLIKELRGTRSQAVFGELLGLSQSAISDYEKGKRMPDPDAMDKIATYCNLMPEQLLATFYGRIYTEPDQASIVVAPSTPQLTIDEQIRQMNLGEKARLLEKLSQAIRQDICG